MSGPRSFPLRFEPMDGRCLPSHAPASPDFSPRPPAEESRQHAPPHLVDARHPPRPASETPPPPIAAILTVSARPPVAPADAELPAVLTIVSPPRASAAIVRDSRPPSGIAALLATEKATGNPAGVAVAGVALTHDLGTAWADVVATSLVSVGLTGFVAGSLGDARTGLYADGQPDLPTDTVADPSGPTPAGLPAAAEPVRSLANALADALPFAGTLPFGVDALGQAASALLGRLEATTAEATDEPLSRDLAWLSAAAAALGGAGSAGGGAAERRRAAAAPGPRSLLVAWGGRHARD